MTGQTSHSQRRRSWLRLIAAAGALLLMALGHSPVSAAPTLTASKNPVPIYSPATTGTTTVTWDGVPVPPGGKVALYLDGVVQIPTILTGHGDIDVTVTLGVNRVVELRQVGQQIALAKLTLTSKEMPAICPKQGCIQKFAPVPHGTFATFAVPTAAQTKLHIEVSTAPPSATYTFASVTSSADSPLGTMHNLNLLNLKPKTLYHFVVRAEDIGGFKYFQKGTFTTLKQRIDVTFSQIHVADDSDAMTAGDLKFWFTVENQAPMTQFYGDNVVSSGTVQNIALTGTILDSHGTLDLKVQGFDDDEDDWDSCPDSPPYLGSGSNDCADWIQKTWQSLNLTVSGLGEAYTAPFSIVASEYGVPLVFTVTGTFAVSYF